MALRQSVIEEPESSMLEIGYSILKDILALAKLTEADPIDPGTLDVAKLKEWKIVPVEDPDADFRWLAPRNLFAQTEAPDAKFEVVWVTDQWRRSKRKLVRNTHDGKLDLILVRTKRMDGGRNL